MFKRDTPKSVGYTKQGLFITSGYDKKYINNTIDGLGLNHNTLKQVRELWYRISRTDKTVEDIQRITTIQAKMSLITTLFTKYDWFYGYYKRTFAHEPFSEHIKTATISVLDPPEKS